MRKRHPESVQRKVIRFWFQVHSVEEIASKADISVGSARNIVPLEIYDVTLGRPQGRGGASSSQV